MRVDDFFRYLSDLAYFAILVATLTDAVRQPRRVTIDAALFFGVLASVIAASLLLRLTVTTPLVSSALVALVMSLPYLLLRLPTTSRVCTGSFALPRSSGSFPSSCWHSPPASPIRRGTRCCSWSTSPSSRRTPLPVSLVNRDTSRASHGGECRR